MHLRRGVFIALCLLLCAAAASAQERFGTLTGLVTDQQSAPVPGVSVVVTNNQNGEARTYVTDAGGKYVAPDVTPGRYTVVFQITGFQTIKLTDVSVVLGRAFTLDANSAAAVIPGTSCGRVTSRNARHSVAPKSSAASSSERSIVRRRDKTTKTT